VKDFAFLILNELGKPLHFRELTEVIADRFEKDVNVATVHNELIKDERFILVGRGLYALRS
jgi:DNA-directed RNA polymerase delta subunit